jgi:hypothetical protein
MRRPGILIGEKASVPAGAFFVWKRLELSPLAYATQSMEVQPMGTSPPRCQAFGAPSPYGGVPFFDYVKQANFAWYPGTIVKQSREPDLAQSIFQPVAAEGLSIGLH